MNFWIVTTDPKYATAAAVLFTQENGNKHRYKIKSTKQKIKTESVRDCRIWCQRSQNKLVLIYISILMTGFSKLFTNLRCLKLERLKKRVIHPVRKTNYVDNDIKFNSKLYNFKRNKIAY